MNTIIIMVHSDIYALSASHEALLGITMRSYWARWRLKSPASGLFTGTFNQAQIKENIKAPRHWPLYRNSTGTSEFPT